MSALGRALGLTDPKLAAHLGAIETSGYDFDALKVRRCLALCS